MFEKQLAHFLKDAKKVVILCVGNELRCDDAAGLIVGRELQKRITANTEIFISHTVPENFTGLLKRSKPTHIMLVDTVYIPDKQPGSVLLLKKNDISKDLIHTHSIPLTYLMGYIEDRCDAHCILIGIVPKNLKFGLELSIEIKKAIAKVVRTVSKVLEQKG